MSTDPADGQGRSARKRQAIMAAATSLFLRNGYQGTSMDDIAALAVVSKQTVYKNFADKERLFTDIVLGIAASSDKIIKTMINALSGADDLEQALTGLARRYLSGVMRPHVLQLRRLVIAEADRFPVLARGYFERAHARAFTALAAAFGDLARAGLLRIDDPLMAASHFAYLVLSIPQERAMFRAGEQFTAAELEQFADAGVRVFLAAYRA
jgi:TetR/AcrR family transcriptional regulator, mexJK operon transcriptional repressor